MAVNLGPFRVVTEFELGGSFLLLTLHLGTQRSGWEEIYVGFPHLSERYSIFGGGNFPSEFVRGVVSGEVFDHYLVAFDLGYVTDADTIIAQMRVSTLNSLEPEFATPVQGDAIIRYDIFDGDMQSIFDGLIDTLDDAWNDPDWNNAPFEFIVDTITSLGGTHKNHIDISITTPRYPDTANNITGQAAARYSWGSEQGTLWETNPDGYVMVYDPSNEEEPMTIGTGPVREWW